VCRIEELMAKRNGCGWLGRIGGRGILLKIGLTRIVAPFLCAAVIVGVAGSHAEAGLGGDSSSVENDAQALGVANTASANTVQAESSSAGSSSVQTFVLRSSTGEKFTWREFTTGANLKVREYVSPKGKVFGVAWQGPQPPDLSVLLSSFFDGWQDAADNGGAQSLHRSDIRTSSVVVQMGGQMGFVTGRAWVPALVPQGVDARDTIK